MALHEEHQHRLTLSSIVVDSGRDPVAVTNGADEGSKAPRLPRWTRQEILVLIQGKKVAENRVRRGRSAGMAFGSPQAEPKWASVSSYCKRHGVNRGPVQCRKRWSNLAGDFKKIKEWESQIKDETESFWVMRNDLRRERKLPGFFDKEVYDILNGGVSSGAPSGLALALATPTATRAEEVDPEIETEAEVEAEVEMVFDSGRSAAADDGLFSDFEQSGAQIREETMPKETPEKDTPTTTATPAVPAPVPLSEKQFQPFASRGMTTGRGTDEKHPAMNAEAGSASQGQKRKRLASEGDSETATLHDQLVDVLERNGRILSAQLEAQNIGLKLDREERKDNTNNIVAVLNKLADALGRIADKL